MAKNTLHCSFCGRSRDEVKILIAGQEGHICENCVEHAQEIIEQELMIRSETTPGSSQFKLNVKKPNNYVLASTVIPTIITVNTELIKKEIGDCAWGGFSHLAHILFNANN